MDEELFELTADSVTVEITDAATGKGPDHDRCGGHSH